MASLLVVKNANFSSVSLDKVDIGSVIWLENDFTWGVGGIYRKGESTDNAGRAISMITPLPFASQKTIIKGANGYKIMSLLIDTTATLPNTSDYRYTNFGLDNLQDVVEIPAGYYWEVTIACPEGETASVNDGNNSLLIQEINI